MNARIREIGTYSAHADQGELVAWTMARAPVRLSIFLNHGEVGALAALRSHLIAAGVPAGRIVTPEPDEAFGNRSTHEKSHAAS